MARLKTKTVGGALDAPVGSWHRTTPSRCACHPSLTKEGKGTF